ncbi:MAG: amidase family protein [Jiangellaceae bacterium]
MTEIVFRSATAAAEMVRRREISSRELTEMLFARIDAVDHRVNAVVDLRREAALKEAAAADEAIARGGPLGALHGVPMTVKDSFDVAGLHTTWGNPGFKDFVADSDATVVARLRQVGAIIIGKTNVAFMLADYGQTANDLHGVTRNPWDTARTPGGSTGGAAAALSAGMTFLEYGSDLVGSIRIPASFCGVYGLKPSAGIVPVTGFQPPGTTLAGPSEMTYMSAVGPLGRSARDLRVALEVTAGPESPAAGAYSWNPSRPRHTRLADFRVGVVFDHAHTPVSSEVTAPLSDAVDALARAGATVVEGWPDGMDPVQHYESFGFHVRLFLAFQQPGEDFATLSEVISHESERMAARAAWNRYFDDTDVFLCPVNFTPAFPHDTRPFDQRTIMTPEGERPYDDQPFWISHASLPGLPAVTAPVGRTAGGLPVGAQIVGPLFEDHTAITFAELLADLIGGFESPPV